MSSEVMDTHRVNDGEPPTALKNMTLERSSPVSVLSTPLCSEMSLSALAAQCLREIDRYGQGEPSTDTYGVELLRRATVEDDQEAWLWVLHCFGGAGTRLAASSSQESGSVSPGERRVLCGASV
jgi:hypothetical protein